METVQKSQQSNIVKRHFHTFDALRFFAFLKVFLLHIPVFAFPWFNYLKAGGGIGVQFFFVLSGFLITYIICEEKKQTGSLNLRNFFVRRILRIWPLYYLMIAVAYTTPYILEYFVSLPSSAEGYEPQLWVSVLFLENYKMMLTHQHANVSPLSIMWTLCIEEHFYIIWGLLLYYTTIKALPKIIMICVFTGLLSRVVYVYYNIPTSDILTTIDLFAFGAIPAYWLVHQPEKLSTVLNAISYKAKQLFIACLIVVVGLCSQLESDGDFILVTTLLGGLFAILIAMTLGGKKPIKIGDRNLLSRLGVYTYGLYLYHILVLNLLKQVFVNAEWSLDKPIVAVLFIILSLLLTIISSMLSYHLFEKHFLKLKKYFRT